MTKIGFIGSGNMAFALIKAMNDNNSIIASDKSKERLDFVKKETGINITLDNTKVVENSKVIFLAVKPQNIEEVLNEIKDSIKDQIIISIAAGITLNFIKSKLNYNKIVRVMPNTPCLVSEMAAGFAIGKLNDNEIKLVEELLNSAGKAFLLKEENLDAVTGLSGSGPAFVAYLIQSLAEGGVKQGLSKDIANELATRTTLGTAKLLIEQGMSTKELIDMVTSPNGTTHAGRQVLEKSDVKESLIKTIEAATKRSKELGK
jgi:pyrroline-5-carboxylate reductase